MTALLDKTQLYQLLLFFRAAGRQRILLLSSPLKPANPPPTSNMQTLEDLLKSDSELASLPEIYIRVSELLESERSSARQIGEVVETDPALTARTLKMVNSAYYGLQREVASVAQAISILGRDRLRQILIGTVMGGIFKSFDNEVLPLQAFWHHSVKTALLSRYMAQHSALDDLAETLFTAGLLHQIGSLILAHRLPQQARQVEQAVSYDHEDLCMAETRLIGFTHCQTGASFICHWGLPRVLADCARHYLTPREAGENEQLVELIFMANRLAYFDELIEQDKITDLLDQLSGLKALGLSVEGITDACILAEQHVFEVMDTLGMNPMVIETD